MTLEQVQTVCNAKPFRPFTLHLADGRSIPVSHRELIMAAPNGRTLALFHEDSFHLIDLLLVTDLETKVQNGSRRKRN